MTLEIRSKNLTSLGTVEQGTLGYYVLRKKKKKDLERGESLQPLHLKSLVNQPLPPQSPPPRTRI